MGINSNLSSYNKKKFTNVHFYFGLKKNKINVFFNMFILGFKDKLAIIYPEIIITQCKRIFLFCYNLILNNGLLIFLNFNISLVNKYIFILVCRSLQGIISMKWINGLLTNFLLKKPSVFIASNIKNYFPLKESFIRNIPFIFIDNNFLSLHKSFYLILSKVNRKKFIFFFYKNLSNFILISKLYKFIVK